MRINFFASVLIVLFIRDLTLRAYASEYQIISFEAKSSGISDGLLQIWNKVHFNIKQLSTFHTAYMIMIRRILVEMISAAWGFDLADFSICCQLLEVAVHRRAADIWML